MTWCGDDGRQDEMVALVSTGLKVVLDNLIIKLASFDINKPVEAFKGEAGLNFNSVTHCW